MRRTLALLVAVVALAGCGASEDKTDGPKATVAAGEDETTTAPETTEAEPEAAAGSKDAPLPVGEKAVIGEWEVAVTEIVPDATAAVLAENEFNEDPSKGQYMTVKVAATYQGETEGMPATSLVVALSGGDAVQYKNFECSAVVGAMEFPTLEPGGTAEVLVCLDVPAAALDGGLVFVEDQLAPFDEDGVRAYWSLPT